jgi:hypothetical protein
MSSTNAVRSGRAGFVAREHCVACRSRDLVTLDSGRFSDEPVRGFLEQDPWGVSPLPFLQDHPWEYVRCAGCGQAFHKWLLTPEWQHVRFTEWMSEDSIREFEAAHGMDAPAWMFGAATGLVKHVLSLEAMTRAVRGGGPVRVLDFGCGWGDFLATAGQFGFQAFGVDRDPDRRRAASARGVVVFPDLDEAGKDIGGGYHAVTLFQVLEHLEEPFETLAALGEWMVDGAVLVLEVPNCEGVVGIKSRSDYYNAHPLEHINCFTPTSLRAIATRAGFTPVRPAIAHVTTSPGKVLKGEAKRWARAVLSPGTHQYFRRA